MLIKNYILPRSEKAIEKIDECLKLFEKKSFGFEKKNSAPDTETLVLVPDTETWFQLYTNLNQRGQIAPPPTMLAHPANYALLEI